MVPVHPRRRGEHSSSNIPGVIPSGSSPQARGTPQCAVVQYRHTRFIPAGAGNTLCTPDPWSPRTVHPRRRGEHRSAAVSGDSAKRFIPAGAGNTSISSWDFVIVAGSSPQARGTRPIVTIATIENRFIPAGAGNTPLCAYKSYGRSVHPRRRGEHKFAANPGRYRRGSSPQARGTRLATRNPETWGRFIPAGAGNTWDGLARYDATPVHPRRRGEHFLSDQIGSPGVGSSPQARGTHTACSSMPSIARFIPAGAGNTPPGRQPGGRGPVHPRRRGEHLLVDLAIDFDSGSSPQARGTHRSGLVLNLRPRFIPAGAGNTAERGV